MKTHMKQDGALPRTPEDLERKYEFEKRFRELEKKAEKSYVDQQLDTKAPAGYGLGTSGASVTDLNDALNCGFFAWGSDCANAPFSYGMGMTINRFNGRYTQMLFNPWMGGYGQIVVRHFDGTKWLPDEWLNPPMIAAAEYRTTERWGGKAVYAMLIDCKTLPSQGQKSVTTTIPSSANVLSAVGIAVKSDGEAEPMPCVSSTGAIRCAFFVTRSKNIAINAFDDMSSYNGYVTVKYTKD